MKKKPHKLNIISLFGTIMISVLFFSFIWEFLIEEFFFNEIDPEPIHIKLEFMITSTVFAILAVIVPIYLLKKSEDKLISAISNLNASENKYKSIFEQASDSVILHKPGSINFFDFNEASYTNLDYTKDEFQKLTLDDIDIEKSLKEKEKISETVLKQGKHIFETKLITKYGEIRDVLVKIKLVSMNGEDIFQSSWTDITDRKTASTIRKDFSRKLLNTLEQERKRIAGDMHDSLAQNLLTIKSSINKCLNSKNIEKDILESLQEASITTVLSLEEIRNVASGLRPPQLDQLGLKKTLQGLAKKVLNSSGVLIETKFEIDKTVIPQEISINIYRITQEALNNIIKHSMASEIKISINISNDILLLEIKDDGRGFDYELQKKKSTSSSVTGFGLIGIAERAEIFGGSLAVDSSIGKGTKLLISIPLKQGVY